MAKTPYFHCRGHGFNPRAAKKTEKKKETDECIKMWYIHAIEYCSAIKRINFDTCSNTDRPRGHDAK